jgi:hypothetical protein
MGLKKWELTNCKCQVPLINPEIEDIAQTNQQTNQPTNDANDDNKDEEFLAATWTTHIQLNSDHLPITITLPSDDALPPRVAKTFTNFRKANWPAFIRESEGVFRGLQKPTSVGAGEKFFCDVPLTAAKHAILAGFRKDCKPGRAELMF